MASLFSMCLEAISNEFVALKSSLDSLSANSLCDLYYHMVKRERKSEVKKELSELKTFLKLLTSNLKRHELHWIFQVISNFEYNQMEISKASGAGREAIEFQNDTALRAVIPAAFAEECCLKIADATKRNTLYKNGMLIGEFLHNAGMFYESAKVLRQSLFVALSSNDLDSLKKTLVCLEKLLLSQCHYSMFEETRETFDTATAIIKKLRSSECCVNLSRIYSAFANYHLVECRYNEALKWGVEALKELDLSFIEPRTTVDILRQAAKSCAVKREFHKAELLITEAVYLARDIYGSSSVKYADALLDYGYFLINRDSVHKAVAVYTDVLEIRKSAFGYFNVLTAIAYEDLSYALYVREYSSGNFTVAKEYANDAIRIMSLLLPEDHLQLASAKRVKALILEEIAIDSMGTPMELQLLREAEKLHLAALDVSTKIFGEIHVSTAKHYGNLGRLYQTMKKYDDAESMHLKAISIKEKLLGPYDYEVALSVGHLASLYNYDMEEYSKAEILHLRSIDIGLKLFGKDYSGLEYDYRGLLQVYNMKGNHAKLSEYNRILSEWRILQDQKSAASKENPLVNSKYSKSLTLVLNDFFQMEWMRNTESNLVAPH